MFTGRTLVLFFIALMLAIAAVIIAQRWVQSLGQPPAQQVEQSKVLVAIRDIVPWQKVEGSLVREVDWPKDAMTPDMFTDKAQLLGKIAVAPVFAGEPLSAKRVLDPTGGSPFALSIPPNMRAFTIRVNDVSGVGGFLARDNRVDIFASTKVSRPGGDFTKTELLAQDVRVLAVDQEASSETNKPKVVRSVTLEMLPEKAEAVFRAEQEGTIHLALRNPTDETVVDSRDVQQAEPLPVAAAAGPAAPAGRSVTIIGGTSSGIAVIKARCDRFECK